MQLTHGVPFRALQLINVAYQEVGDQLPAHNNKMQALTGKFLNAHQPDTTWPWTEVVNRSTKMSGVITYRNFSILATIVEFMVMHPGLLTVSVKGSPDKGHHMPTCPFLATIDGEVHCHRLIFMQNSELEKMVTRP